MNTEIETRVGELVDFRATTMGRKLMHYTEYAFKLLLEVSS